MNVSPLSTFVEHTQSRRSGNGDEVQLVSIDRFSFEMKIYRFAVLLTS
jgi:hypothetical protein